MVGMWQPFFWDAVAHRLWVIGTSPPERISLWSRDDAIFGNIVPGKVWKDIYAIWHKQVEQILHGHRASLGFKNRGLETGLKSCESSFRRWETSLSHWIIPAGLPLCCQCTAAVFLDYINDSGIVVTVMHSQGGEATGEWRVWPLCTVYRGQIPCSYQTTSTGALQLPSSV